MQTRRTTRGNTVRNMESDNADSAEEYATTFESDENPTDGLMSSDIEYTDAATASETEITCKLNVPSHVMRTAGTPDTLVNQRTGVDQTEGSAATTSPLILRHPVICTSNATQSNGDNERRGDGKQANTPARLLSTEVRRKEIRQLEVGDHRDEEITRGVTAERTGHQQPAGQGYRPPRDEGVEIIQRYLQNQKDDQRQSEREQANKRRIFTSNQPRVYYQSQEGLRSSAERIYLQQKLVENQSKRRTMYNETDTEATVTEDDTSNYDSDTIQKLIDGQLPLEQKEREKINWEKVRRIMAKKEQEKAKNIKRAIAKQITKEKKQERVCLTKAEKRHSYDQRKYVDEENMDSPGTDDTSDYTTEQEDAEVFHNRFRGILPPGSSSDWTSWPWRKFVKARKDFKKFERSSSLARGAGRRPAKKETVPMQPRRAEVPTFQEGVEERILKGLKETQGLTDQAIKKAIAAAASGQYREEWAVQHQDEMASIQKPKIGDSHNQVKSSNSELSTLVNEAVMAAIKSASITQSIALPSGKSKEEATPSHQSISSTTSVSLPSLPEQEDVIKSMPETVIQDQEKRIRQLQSETSWLQSRQKNRDDSKMLTVPVFKGGNWATFRNQFEKIAQQLEWSEKKKATSLYIAIQGEAADALGASESTTWSYDHLVRHMERRHGRNKTWGDIIPLAFQMRKQPSQNLCQYYDQIIKALGTADLRQKDSQMLAFMSFMNGLQAYDEMARYVLTHLKEDERTIEAAFDKAKDWEALNGPCGYRKIETYQINMVGAEEQTRVKGVTNQDRVERERPVTSGNQTSNRSQDTSSVLREINNLGSHMNGRLDIFDRRVRNLESRKSPEQEQGNRQYNQRGGSGQFHSTRGNFNNNGYQNRNGRGGYNGGNNTSQTYHRSNDDRRQENQPRTTPAPSRPAQNAQDSRAEGTASSRPAAANRA